MYLLLSMLVGNPSVCASLQAVMPLLDDHGSHSVGMVGGPMAHLLEQNYLILNQYKQNMQQYKVHENTDLLVRFRNNILTILNQMNSMSGLMQDMPPLPVRLNIELASDFLPKAGSSMYSAGSQPIIQGQPSQSQRISGSEPIACIGVLDG